MSTHLARKSLIIFALACLTGLVSSCARGLPTAANTTASASTSARTRAMIHRAAGQPLEGEVAVTLTPGTNPEDVATTYGATVLEWDSNERLASFEPGRGDTPASLLSRLNADVRVMTAESNAGFQVAEASQKSFAFDDGRNTADDFAAQPAFAAVHLNRGLAVSQGYGVRVAILDTGIDPDHPLFAGRIGAAYDFLEQRTGATELAYGIDSNNDGHIDGAYGHGTHVAGIVATVAPGATLLIARVLDSDGQGDVVTVAAGIHWAVAQGADIINMSLGSLTRSTAIEAAIDEAQSHGVLVVASAGNWGAEIPQEYPARDEAAMAIAASDAYAAPAPWSSFEDYVVLSAPGVAIRSAYPGGLYRQWSGTSMSTPFVSATAALLRSKHPNWLRADYVTRLGSTAIPMVGLLEGQVDMFGAGMLDIGGALAPDAPPGDDNWIVQPGMRH